jgi:hypothetical protein
MVPGNAFCCCENHPPLFTNVEFFYLQCACAAAYDKLAKWKFRIHGGIDGASHFVVWCVVATDKLATTIFKGYKAAVDMYGHPIRIRSDYAAEHNLVRADQERARPDVIKPFLTGSSVHNQVYLESNMQCIPSNKRSSCLVEFPKCDQCGCRGLSTSGVRCGRRQHGSTTPFSL